MSREINVLGVAGSLRAESYNKALIRNAQKLAPEGMRVTLYEKLIDMPHFNVDVEAKGDPAAVADFRRLVIEADALLIATPEYNWNLPGALKDAIDWVSRAGAAGGPVPLRGKPIGLIGTSTTTTGSTRAQMSLRQTFVNTQSPVMPAPQVQIPFARDKFDDQGNLTDEESLSRLKAFLDGFLVWTRRFVKG